MFNAFFVQINNFVAIYTTRESDAVLASRFFLSDFVLLLVRISSQLVCQKKIFNCFSLFASLELCMTI